MKTKKDMKEESEKLQTHFSDMTEAQANNYLVELHETPYWQAIKRFNAKNYELIESSLHTIDPFKDPTEMARNQGKGWGILALEDYVENEIKTRKAAAAKAEKAKNPGTGVQSDL